MARQAVAYILLSRRARSTVAYGAMKFDQHVLRRVGVRETGRTTRALVFGGRAAARVGTKFVPIVGWASAAYDTYQFGRWVHERLK
jgi:hypothetical protein